MKRNFFFIIAVAGLTSLTACKNESEPKAEKPKTDKVEVKKPTSTSAGSGEITIITPSGFTRMDTTTMGQKAIFLMSDREGNTDMFQENMNVISESIGDMSMESYMSLTEGNMDKFLQKYKKRGINDITVDGTPAKSYDYSHSMSGYDIDANVVILIKNARAYIITSTALAGGMDKWKPKFDEAINSFHVE